MVKKKERTKKEKFTCLGPWKLEMRRKIGKKKERTKKEKFTCLGSLETRDEEERLVKKKREQRKRKLPALGPWKLEMRRKDW